MKNFIENYFNNILSEVSNEVIRDVNDKFTNVKIDELSIINYEFTVKNKITAMYPDSSIKVDFDNDSNQIIIDLDVLSNIKMGDKPITYNKLKTHTLNNTNSCSVCSVQIRHFKPPQSEEIIFYSNEGNSSCKEIQIKNIIK